ncbi:MAG: hypothetical protein PHY09_01085 [Desulfuromonadaceae bacterium]|nr:hypothetical protein [Desulfuromonadaceae bacterium]MDD5104910.1 hypothetical protein [Desulfuromonadaceae bacterium]
MGLIKCIKRLFGVKPLPKETLKKEEALLLLNDARHIFKSLGKQMWLTDGTLLGYFREGEFLSHDFDVDVGAFIDEFSQQLVNAFKAAGFELKRVYGTIDCGLELTLEKHGVKMDIFFFYRDGQTLWHGAWRRVEKQRNLIRYRYEPFEFKKVDFLGHEFEIPADTLKYVCTKYGEGWATPEKSWDWAFGPANAEATEIYMPDDKHSGKFEIK